MEEDSEPPRKLTRHRLTRACDRCRSRRVKCTPVIGTDQESAVCELCAEYRSTCLFTAPARKRGPLPRTGRGRLHSPPSADSHDSVPSPRQDRPQGTSSLRVSRLRDIPRRRIDELLTVYFTHVHNVWPLLYKPMFEVSKAPELLLLAMLCIAACVYNTHDDFDAERLFEMADLAIQQAQSQPSIELAQAMLLMSFRQTGNGHKASAYGFGSRATAVILTLGLDSIPSTPTSHEERERRSRVFWNAYVLDKCMAEETGRSFSLPYRHCSTPLPSTEETDELEPWPPLPTTSTARPVGVRHVVPRRGHIISCFLWTCRMAMIAEDILQLGYQGPPTGTPWDDQFAAGARAGRSPENIAYQLEMWKQHMPVTFQVDINSSTPPTPHYVINVIYFHATKILLYARSLQRRASYLTDPVDPLCGSVAERDRRECSDAALHILEMVDLLECHQMLEQTSSDIIHLLCLAILVQVFDSTSSDLSTAQLAKARFNRCVVHLKKVSATWPAASTSKVFFDAVIQGGHEVMAGVYDIPTTSPTPSSPNEGLQRIRQIVYDDRRTAADPAAVFQLPEVFWNHLTREIGPNFGSLHATGGPAASTVAMSYTTLVDEDFAWDQLVVPHVADATVIPTPTADLFASSGVGQPDQSDISAALIRFITESAGNIQ